MRQDSEIRTKRIFGYTGKTLKALGVSPDSTLQLAIQLAQRRVHGTTVGTYETVGLTTFLKGRTETCRVVSSETVRFVDAMLAYLDASPGAPLREGAPGRDEVRALFKEAAAAHMGCVKHAISGKGVDRHLLSMQIPLGFLPGNPPPPPSGQAAELFADPAFTASQTFKLSTSNNSYLTNAGGMFGPVHPDGYGIGYLSRPEYTYFAVERKHSSKDPKLSSPAMISACVSMLGEIHKLFDIPAVGSTAKL